MRRNGSTGSGSAAQSVWMDAVGERGAKAGQARISSAGQQTASLRLVRTPGPEAVDIRRALPGRSSSWIKSNSPWKVVEGDRFFAVAIFGAEPQYPL